MQLKEIDLDELPERFVLKCTHDSQSTFVCTDKSNFDFVDAKKRLGVALPSKLVLARPRVGLSRYPAAHCGGSISRRTGKDDSD